MALGLKGGIQSWDALREAASQGYTDGITVLATIETIERSNRPALLENLASTDAGFAARILRNAAFAYIQIIVVRAFAPVRHADDLHLRAAIEFLRQPGQLNSVVDPSERADLQAAIMLFDAADVDPRLVTLRHMRNKELAHWGQYGATIGRPRVRDLFGLSEDTCAIWEKLSFGAGTILIPIRNQIDLYRDGADAFWSKWE